MATNYTYSKLTASNQVVLNVIKTSPTNIQMRYINPKNLSQTTEYGVNGGYFILGSTECLSIAANNNVPVNGAIGTYGSGWKNESYNRGTAIYDAVTGEMFNQVVDTINNLGVLDKSKYWAVGGISMSPLASGTAWHDQAVKENMQNIDGVAQRAGLLWDSSYNVYLVVTANLVSAAAFRAACAEKLSPLLLDGIFLDGSGSAQLKCAEANITGDNRPLCQIVALKNHS